MKKSENIIKVKSFSFALDIITLYQLLLNENEFIISRQLMKSGTSIGANVEEATAAQSRRDFVSKMAIASKEARETNYWLRLLDESNLTDIDVEDWIFKSEELVKILTSIVKTSNSSK